MAKSTHILGSVTVWIFWVARQFVLSQGRQVFREGMDFSVHDRRGKCSLTQDHGKLVYCRILRLVHYYGLGYMPAIDMRLVFGASWETAIETSGTVQHRG